MPETTNKPQKKGGKGKLRGAKDGVPFSKENQPSPESKKAGWAKKKSGQELAKAILELKFYGKTKSQIGKQAAEYFGVPEEEITIEQIMIFRQAEKAIQEGDTQAFKVVLDRAHGAPKQEIENTGGMAITITRKIIDAGNKSKPDLHSAAE